MNDYKKNIESILKNNDTWLEFLQDLRDNACLLEEMDLKGNAEIVRTAIEALIDWNPVRRESISRLTGGRYE